MTTGTASFLAMVAGWATPLAGMALGQLATTGRTSDIVVTGFWVGLFALISWGLGVRPLMQKFRAKKIFSDLKFSWLGWGLLAVGIYSVLLPPLFGADMFIIIWYPAVMGCVAGFVFALLLKLPEKKKNG